MKRESICYLMCLLHLANSHAHLWRVPVAFEIRDEPCRTMKRYGHEKQLQCAPALYLTRSGWGAGMNRVTDVQLLIEQASAAQAPDRPQIGPREPKRPVQPVTHLLPRAQPALAHVSLASPGGSGVRRGPRELVLCSGILICNMSSLLALSCLLFVKWAL